MKYIALTLITILSLMLTNCGNDSSSSPMFSQVQTSYEDLHVYEGSPQGASEVNLMTNESWDKDSLYQTRVTYGYFGTAGNNLSGQNKITFEFLGDKNELLSFVDGNTNQRIISSYTLEDDSLFILKDGTTPIFVANKDEDGSFYRIISLQRAMIKSAAEPLDSIERFDGRKTLDMNSVLKLAGFPNKETMTGKKDTIMWCNVKYIYR